MACPKDRKAIALPFGKDPAMLIDFHTHAFPDKLAPRAIGVLAERANMVPETNGTVSALLSRMEEWHVDRAVVLNIATNAHQQSKVNQFAIDTLRAHGDRLTPLGSIYPIESAAERDRLAEMERLADAGIPGLKLHPDYMEHFLDDPAYTPILDCASEMGMFVVLHTGMDVYFPDCIHATPDMIRTVLCRHPKLTLICAHYGGNCLWDEAEEKIAGERCYMDISMGVKMGLSVEQARRILLRHDPDRILFGSDCPWGDVPGNLAFLEAMRLPAELVDKILYKNAGTLLQL